MVISPPSRHPLVKRLISPEMTLFGRRDQGDLNFQPKKKQTAFQSCRHFKAQKVCRSVLMPKNPLYYLITQMYGREETKDAEWMMFNSKHLLNRCELLELEGNRHFYQWRYQQAMELYEAAMTADQDYDCARYHLIVGKQREALEDYPEALKRYQAAVQIEPESPDAYLELGELLMKFKQFDTALECFQDAQRQCPGHAQILSNIALATKKLEEYFACNSQDRRE